MNELTMIVGIAVIALLTGGGIGYWVADRRARQQAAKTEDVQQRFDDYRKEVTSHFGRTAEHFQAIGEQYRELYEHMASGAETLFDAPDPAAKLDTAAPVAIAETAASERVEGDTEAPTEQVETEEARAVDAGAAAAANNADDAATTEPREVDATAEPTVEDADTANSASAPDDGGGRTYH